MYGKASAEVIGFRAKPGTEGGSDWIPARSHLIRFSLPLFQSINADCSLGNPTSFYNLGAFKKVGIGLSAMPCVMSAFSEISEKGERYHDLVAQV
jgi:hypothetical protein